ncbi:uncharacterized protein EDB93DRAFT_1250216 [Suillus bovinus]|uniref:uncharacterized protein n=1 Tax=Suillus bovinus TaxID=48563 RepID=UPI001B86BA03|nr:uncharacterized protein EDB93DRAFT_1250216 [Suillus bovinus]KAG2148157.1 hypothetical protein EDB93DRAFT_1250216 [Suillus bovinus]
MDSSPPLSPVQSSSPPSFPAQMNSPTILSSPDSSSPSGTTLLLNASHLSISQQSKPAPSQADESLFFRSDKMSNSQLSRKYIPYPANPAPLELHYAAQVMKSKFQPEFSLEETQKHGQAELEDDKQYLQAVYEDECEILCVSSTQTDQIAKLLSSHVKRAFLKPTAVFPLHLNSGLPCIGTREPSEPSDPEMSDESYLDKLPEDSDHGSEDSSKGAGSEKSAG